MASSGKGMVWDPAADRKLLLGTLSLSGITVDKEALARYMSTSEITVTASAIDNRLKRLRAMAKSEGPVGEATTPKSTPRKRTAATDDEKGTPSKKPKSTTKSKGGKGKPVATEAGDEDEEEAPSNDAVKNEQVDEDDFEM